MLKQLVSTSIKSTISCNLFNGLLFKENISKSININNYRDDFRTRLQGEIGDIKKAGTFKEERVITSKQRSHITVKESDAKVLNFCANNYLGLSAHPKVIEKASDYLQKYGAGLSSVRFICGTQAIHKELEQKVSEFHQKEDTILYPSCFDANAGIFEALLTKEDAVLSDELNHASIIDGVRLCKANRYRYKHMDMKDLDKQLKDATKNGSRTKLVVTDGVFSMDGDVAPLKDICDVCEENDAILMIDECHAGGFYGKSGRGTPEYFGVMDRVDIINSTFGKALGGASGGYTSATKEIVTMLRQKGRPYLFSNTIPPPVVGAALAAFDVVDNEPHLLKQLKSNTTLFRSKMNEAGFELRGEDHPIVPVMLGDAKLASVMADELLKENIYVIGFSYPVVPKGLARIRVQLSAAHSTEDVNKCVDAFVKIGKELKVID